MHKAFSWPLGLVRGWAVSLAARGTLFGLID